MNKRKPKLTLLKYVDQYLSERDVSPHYAEVIRMLCRKLSAFYGGVLRLDQLECKLINDWLVHLREIGKSHHTLATYRAGILCVWNAAYVDELNNTPPLRVRKIKKPRLVVEAYTHAEIRQLLSGAENLRGYDLNGNKRSDFWQALIHAAYASGLRRGDLIAVSSSSVADDGLCTVIQHKTGYPVTVRFSAETLQHAAKLKSDKRLLLPWPYRTDSMTTAFRLVRNAAGIDRGSFRWLRRSAGSYAESERYGAGAQLLGHRDHNVFTRHYEDKSIAVTKPVEPPSVARLNGDSRKGAQ